MENEEAGFRQIGNLLQKIGTLPHPSEWPATLKPRNSGTTGLPSPVKPQPSSIGRQRGGIGAVTPVELSEMAETGKDADLTDLALEASLRRLKALSPNLIETGIIGEWGYEPVLRIAGEGVDQSALADAAELVRAACRPASETTIIAELAKLGYKTKAKAEDIGDAKMRLLAYAEELAEFPADIIRSACRTAARTETFFPSVSELRGLCQRAMRLRQGLKDDIRKAMK